MPGRLFKTIRYADKDIRKCHVIHVRHSSCTRCCSVNFTTNRNITRKDKRIQEEEDSKVIDVLRKFSQVTLPVMKPVNRQRLSLFFLSRLEPRPRSSRLCVLPLGQHTLPKTVWPEVQVRQSVVLSLEEHLSPTQGHRCNLNPNRCYTTRDS